MKRFKTIKQVWKAIDSGKTVYWSNDNYALTIENHDSLPKEYVARMGWDKHFTTNKNRCLRVTCISNWFGSLLVPSELGKLYIKD